MNDSTAETLRQVALRYDIELADEALAKLEQYLALLWDWNTRLNLTRHTDYEKFVSRDLIDTIELSNFLHEGEEVLDVGSGGGIPGITMAILRPDLQISLAESVTKKASVLNEMVSDLDLPVPVFAERAEHVLDDFRFDARTARAVGPLWKFGKWFETQWDKFGRLLVIKGPRWVEERKEARHRGFLRLSEIRRVAEYPMPGTESNSVILKLWRKGVTEPK